VFFAVPLTASSSLHPLARAVLAHSITILCLSCVLAYGTGFAIGSAFHRMKQGPAAPLQAAKAPEPQPQHQAIFEAWEEEVAAGRWEEPAPVEPLFGGSMWDLIDPEEGEQEPPLRWAV
jgi:hypothetical protein